MVKLFLLKRKTGELNNNFLVDCILIKSLKQGGLRGLWRLHVLLQIACTCVFGAALRISTFHHANIRRLIEWMNFSLYSQCHNKIYELSKYSFFSMTEYTHNIPYLNEIIQINWNVIWHFCVCDEKEQLNNKCSY